DARALGAARGNDGNVDVGADLRGLHHLAEATAVTTVRPWRARAGLALVSIHARELPALLPILATDREESAPNPDPVFPRHLSELARFRAVLEPLGFVPHSRDPGAPRVLVDAFGLVADRLGRCRVAVIGGSFVPRGGHNLWEPLLAGAVIVTGPWNDN